MTIEPGSAAELLVKKGHIPQALAQLQPLSGLDKNSRLDLVIALPLRNREALTNLLSELYDPASPLFRQFLTPKQFADRFGPSDQDYRSVLDFARSNHFVVRGTHANRMLLDVNASAAEIERAFHVNLRVYRHPFEARTFFSADVDPSVDSSLPILSVSGLDDFVIPHPMGFRKISNPTSQPGVRAVGAGAAKLAPQGNPLGPTPAVLDGTGSGPTGTFVGSDFRAAYAPGVALDGAGQSVGLLELDSYFPNDVAEYENLAGLPRVPLTNVSVNGFNQLPGSNNGEVALDIEMAISMAPGLDRVLVYEGTKPIDVLNRMATDNLARQLSSSWTFGPPVDPAREQVFQQFAAQGQSYFQASGDAGAYGSTALSPADDPFVTSVGGTSLATTRPGGPWLSESAWSGSGGGISPNYTIPVWQQAVSMLSNQGSTTMRNVPDVAALADAAIWVISNNGEQGTALGTSAAAPLWAGFIALVNQQAATHHQPAVGFLNPAIYAIGQGPAYLAAFHDVISGNNTNSLSPTKFFASPGYDLCTGWGSPTGSNLINALLAPPDSLEVSPGSNSIVMGPVGGPFAPTVITFLLSNSGPSSLSWAVTSISSWSTVSPFGGVLNPGGSSSVQVSLTPGVSNLIAGSYSSNLWFTNLNNGFAQSRQILLYIVSSPLISSQPTSQTLPSGANARFAVGTATNSLLFYQWLKNGTSLQDTPRITGSSTSALMISNVNANDVGTYSVVLSNVAGIATSFAAKLSVTSSPPVIAQQPVSLTALPAASASFSVVTFGDAPISYQWRANGTDIIDGANVSGSRSNVLTLSNVAAGDARSYSVVVSNLFGVQTSIEAGLSVVSLTSPEILQSTVLAFDGANAGHPNGLSRGVDGLIYGTTETGGANNAGTIFRLSNANLQRLYSFSGLSDGERPNGELLQGTDGSLFGTTYGGGSNAFGTIFQLHTDGQLTSLFTLDHTNGVLPTAGLTRSSDGSLFGTAYEGGIFHFGTVFRLDTNGEFSVVFPFGSTNGAFPHSELVQVADGSLYGTTYKGGVYANGTIFRISPAGTFATLASFDGTNGGFPMAALTQSSDGNLFGTTAYGGAFGLGSIFRISTNAVWTNLFSFTGSPNGSHPRAGLFLASDGNLYGTTSDGGSLGNGTVFRMSPDGGLTTIAQFDGFNGSHPEARVLEDSDGSFLGVTRFGGPNDQGVIFRLQVPASPPQITSQPADQTNFVGSTVMLSVASFGTAPLVYQWRENGTNLVDSGNLTGFKSRILIITNVSLANVGTYSVTVSNALGSVLSAPAVLQVVASAPIISQQPTNRTFSPGATAIFHATVLGNEPLSFQWQKDGTNLFDVGNLAGSGTDTLVLTNVTEANNGSYELTITNNLGRTNTTRASLLVIPISAPGTAFSTLLSFAGNEDGGSPSELVDGNDGFLYGTTEFGGSFGNGTCFKVVTNGARSTLVSFDLTNGGLPLAGMVLATNGVFYGTSSAGGSSGGGAIWAMTAEGTQSNLFNFMGGPAGRTPSVALIQGADGDFYGSTVAGGTGGFGTLFRLTQQGVLTVLHSFIGGVDGFSPTELTQLTAGGALYGTTPAGGSFGKGSVFRLTPSGSFSTLYSFTGGFDGYDPVGTLARGDDGALYGATMSNSIRGLEFYGTLFKIDTNGLLTTLYALNFNDGSYPGAGLVLGADGNFYGTTQQGGAAGYGTLFRMTPSGALSTLVEFDGFNDGAVPLTSLTPGSDGNLYGTTSSGGPGGAGTIFRLSFTGPIQITSQPASQNAFIGGIASLSVAVTGAGPISYQWQRNETNLNDNAFVSGTAARVLAFTNLQPSDAGSYSVVVSNVLGSVTSVPVLLSLKVPPPTFQSITRSASNLVLVWASAPGSIYQLQSSSDLSRSGWSNVGNAVTATDVVVKASVPIDSGPQQFYRVLLLP